MSHSVTRFKVLSAGIFSLILVLGVARFAYTPLLPLMQQQAGLGVAAAGWLAAINYAGYLSGALIASRISSLVLKDRLYRIGMVLALVSTSTLCWFGRIDAGVYATVTVATVGAYLTANWAAKEKANG